MRHRAEWKLSQRIKFKLTRRLENTAYPKLNDFDRDRAIARDRYSDLLNWAKHQGTLEGAHKRVLDIGCAWGFGLEVLIGHGYDAYGVDISDRLLGAARLVTPNVINHDAFAPLPYEEKFDLVVCQCVLGYFQEPAGIIRNALAVLKPGGLFLATLNNRKSLFNWPNQVPRSAAEWEAIFAAEDFLSVRLQGYLSFSFLRRIMGLRPLRVPMIGTHIRVAAVKFT